jgi:hypothetical protein
MSAAQDAYDRLVAARRDVTPYEREQAAEEAERERLSAKIKRRLAKVY